MKNKRKTVYVPQVEVDKLIAPYERKWLEDELEKTKWMLRESECKRREEHKAHRKEKDEIMGFFGCTALLVVFAAAALSSAMWTSIFVGLGLVAMMRKVGWL